MDYEWEFCRTPQIFKLSKSAMFFVPCSFIAILMKFLFYTVLFFSSHLLFAQDTLLTREYAESAI